MEQKSLLLIVEILLIISALAGAYQTHHYQTESSTHRNILASTQIVVMSTVQANRYCNKYYEVAEFKGEYFVPSTEVNVSVEDIMKAIEDRNLTNKDLSSNTSLFNEIKAEAHRNAASRETSYKFYEKCNDYIKQASESLERTNESYSMLNKNSNLVKITRWIYLGGMFLSLIILLEAIRPDNVSKKILNS